MDRKAIMPAAENQLRSSGQHSRQPKRVSSAQHLLEMKQKHSPQPLSNGVDGHVTARNQKMDSLTDDVKKSVTFQKKCVAPNSGSLLPNGSIRPMQVQSRILRKSGKSIDVQNDLSNTFKVGGLSLKTGYSANQLSDLQIHLDNNSTNAEERVLVNPLNSNINPVSPVRVKSTTVVSPVSDNSEVTSLLGFSASLESNVGVGLVSPSSLTLSPDEMILAEQYFPVTFGATSYSSCDSKSPLSVSGIWPLQNLTSSSTAKKTVKAGTHRHGKRPGSGQSSSSSNSKSSVERIYLMATDSLSNGYLAQLSSTPYQTQVAQLRVEQLRIEEERIQQLRIVETHDRRQNAANRHETKTVQPLYEPHKYSDEFGFFTENNAKTHKY